MSAAPTRVSCARQLARVSLLLVWLLAASPGCGSDGGGGLAADTGSPPVDTAGGSDAAHDNAAPDGDFPDVVDGNEPIVFDDGYRLYNVAADFVDYAETGAELDAAARAALWDERLEARYPEFFAAALYRGLEGAERDTWKATIIAQFWDDVAPRIDDLRALAASTPALVLDGRTAFREHFPDFAPACDYYLTVAFSFQGKVLPVGDRNAFALGLESFEPDAPEVAITIAHEQFHLHHFATFSVQGGLYRGVWAEGLASYASAVVVPGYRVSQYLGFTGTRMNECWDAFRALCDDVRANLSSTDQAVKRAYLGVEDNDLGIPPAAGYYVGFFLVEALAADDDLATLARWDADTVYGAMEETLPILQPPQ